MVKMHYDAAAKKLRVKDARREGHDSHRHAELMRQVTGHQPATFALKHAKLSPEEERSEYIRLQSRATRRKKSPITLASRVTFLDD